MLFEFTVFLLKIIINAFLIYISCCLIIGIIGVIFIFIIGVIKVAYQYFKKKIK